MHCKLHMWACAARPAGKQRRAPHPLALPCPVVPDPNACIMKKCKVFPVEFVCRGFMTGGAGRRATPPRGWARVRENEPVAAPPHTQQAQQQRQQRQESTCLPQQALPRPVPARRQHRHLAVDALQGGRARVLRQRLPRRHAQERPAGAGWRGGHTFR